MWTHTHKHTQNRWPWKSDFDLQERLVSPSCLTGLHGQQMSTYFMVPLQVPLLLLDVLVLDLLMWKMLLAPSSLSCWISHRCAAAFFSCFQVKDQPSLRSEISKMRKLCCETEELVKRGTSSGRQATWTGSAAAALFRSQQLDQNLDTYQMVSRRCHIQKCSSEQLLASNFGGRAGRAHSSASSCCWLNTAVITEMWRTEEQNIWAHLHAAQSSFNIQITERQLVSGRSLILPHL